MPKCEIKRYVNGHTQTMLFLLPTRVTVTGQEDHFARACEDVDMLMLALRELDNLMSDDTDKKEAPTRFWVDSLDMR